MASPFTQPDFTSQTATEYKTAIDDSIAVVARLAGAFSAQAQDTPNMTVHVNAGPLWDGSTLTEVAAQDTGTITAPSTDDRIDRVVISATDGTASVITGSEATTPSAPSITSGNIPCAQVYLTPSHTEIANSDITDERADLPKGGVTATTGGGSFPNVDANVTASDEEINKLDGYSGDIPTAGWMLLESQTAASDASLDFTGIDGTYDRYMFVLYRVLHDVGSTASVDIRTSSDNGSTWDAGASDYHTLRFRYEAVTSLTADDNTIGITDTIADTTPLSGNVMLDYLGGDNDVTNDYATLGFDVYVVGYRWGGMGSRSQGTAINGVQFLPSAGSFVGGTIELYGWKSP